MEPIYQSDLAYLKGSSLKDYRIRRWFQKWGWTFLLPAILLFPFRGKNKKAISVLGMLSLSSAIILATIHA